MIRSETPLVYHYFTTKYKLIEFEPLRLFATMPEDHTPNTTDLVNFLSHLVTTDSMEEDKKSQRSDGLVNDGPIEQEITPYSNSLDFQPDYDYGYDMGPSFEEPVSETPVEPAAEEAARDLQAELAEADPHQSLTMVRGPFLAGELMENPAKFDLTVKPWEVKHSVADEDMSLMKPFKSTIEISVRSNLAEPFLARSLAMFYMVPLAYAALPEAKDEDQLPVLETNLPFMPTPLQVDLLVLDSLRRHINDPCRLPFFLLPSSLDQIRRHAHWSDSSDQMGIPEHLVRELLVDGWKLGHPAKPDRTAPLPDFLVTAIRFPSGWVGVVATCRRPNPKICFYDGWNSTNPRFEHEWQYEHLFRMTSLIFGIMRMAFPGTPWEFQRAGIWTPWNRIGIHRSVAGAIEAAGSHAYANVAGYDPFGAKSLEALAHLDRAGIGRFFGAHTGRPLGVPVKHGWHIDALHMDHWIRKGNLSLGVQLEEAAKRKMGLWQWQLGQARRLVIADVHYAYIFYFRAWHYGLQDAKRQRRIEGEAPAAGEASQFSAPLEGELSDGAFSSLMSRGSGAESDEYLELSVDEVLPTFVPFPQVSAPPPDVKIVNFAQFMAECVDPETETIFDEVIATGRYRLELETIPYQVVTPEGRPMTRADIEAMWPLTPEDDSDQ